MIICTLFFECFFLRKIKQREKGLEQIRKKLEIEQEESIARELTLRPILSTSPAMQPTQRSKSGEDISDTLYKYDKIYKENRKRLAKKREEVIAAESYLIPKIPISSKKILSHRKNQLSMSTITMSMNDLDDFMILSDGEDANIEKGVVHPDNPDNAVRANESLETFNRSVTTAEKHLNVDRPCAPCLFDGYVALTPSRTGQTIVLTVNSPMHAATSSGSGGGDDHDPDDASLSIQEKEIFTPDGSTLLDQGFNEEKSDNLSQVNNIVGNQCQPSPSGQLTKLVSRKPKETEFIKHCMAGVLMRRPSRADDDPNPNPVLNLKSGQANSAGDESINSGTTNSAIRRFDEILMAEIRSGPQLSQTLNISSANTDDRSGRLQQLIQRGDSMNILRPSSISPTLTQRNLKSVNQ